MKRQIILAFGQEDHRYKSKIEKWATTGKLGNKVSVVALDDPRFYDRNGNLNRPGLGHTLQECALVIVLVGERNHNHPWLDWEGPFCHQWGIKRRLLRIPYSKGNLPEDFKLLQEIAYNPNAIEKELRPTETNSHYF